MDISRHIFTLSAAAVSLALFACHGGDRPEDRVLQMLPAPYIAPVLGLQRYEDCMRQARGQWLRFQIAHKSDREPVRIECVYGPAWLAVVNEWRTM